MNAPVAPAAVQTSELPIASITPSRTHIQEMRRLRFDPKKTQELADSIKNLGVVQAIVVRPDPLKQAVYELVAGERRFLAAKLAGLTHIPATVREFTDDLVLEVQLVENLQRDDLHPLEEAEGYDELMKVKKIGKDEIGEMIGKSRAYVYARLKLLALDLDGRKAFYNGDLDASRALYVARIANPKLRARALAMATEKDWNGEQFKYSVRELRNKLTDKEFSVSLRGAAFNRDDKSFFELVEVKGKKDPQQRPLPDCTSCANRTGNCLDLFNQQDDPEICMEPACFDVKVKQHSKRLRDLAKAEGAPIIKGDDAKKIIPRKNTFNGYVDLDDVCPDDPFPESEPKRNLYSSDADYDKAIEAFVEREAAWTGRTFRQILEGQPVKTVLVDDPRSQKVRTMVPLKEATAALAKTGVKVNTQRYHNKPVTRTPAHQAAQESEEAKAKRLAEEEAQLQRMQIERSFRVALLSAVIEKYGNVLRREEMVEMLEGGTSEDLWDGNQTVHLRTFFGDKFNVRQADTATLVKYVAASTVFDCLRVHSVPKQLLDLARRLKVDPEKIKKSILAAAKAPAAAPKKAAKSKPKKKGGK